MIAQLSRGSWRHWAGEASAGPRAEGRGGESGAQGRPGASAVAASEVRGPHGCPGISVGGGFAGLLQGDCIQCGDCRFMNRLRGQDGRHLYDEDARKLGGAAVLFTVFILFLLSLNCFESPVIFSGCWVTNLGGLHTTHTARKG